MGIVKINDTTFHMNDNLIKKWDKIKSGRLSKLDEDRVYIVDGRERTGKSLFTIQQGSYIDETILEDEKNGRILPRIPLGNATSWESDSDWKKESIKRYKEGTLLPRITFGSKETLNAIRKNKSSDRQTKVIIFDEAFRGMSSKGVLSKENKIMSQTLMEMGQSNLVLWIVSPSFFLLELYPAMLRSNALFHVKKDKNSSKRMVRIFNFRKKAQLYQIGLRKGWGYPLRTNQIVNFYNIYPLGKDFEWRYRLKKQLSLRDSEKTERSEEHKWKKQRDSILSGLYSEINSLRKLSEKLKGWKVSLSPHQIGFIVKKEGKNEEEEE
jgi:hypothetical protein